LPASTKELHIDMEKAVTDIIKVKAWKNIGNG